MSTGSVGIQFATGLQNRSQHVEECPAVESLIVAGIIVLFVLAIGIYLWSTYNGLVKLNLHCEEAWSGIAVQLKRRADLMGLLHG